MVFMGVNTEEGNAPLVEAARANLAEMAKGVAAGGGPGPDARLNVFAQVHGEGEPWRYHIGRDNGRPVPKDQQDVGNGQALMNFIVDSLGAAGHQPNYDRTMLVLWGHAYNFTIGKAKTRSGAIDALDFGELKNVLRLAAGAGAPGLRHSRSTARHRRLRRVRRRDRGARLSAPWLRDYLVGSADWRAHSRVAVRSRARAASGSPGPVDGSRGTRFVDRPPVLRGVTSRRSVSLSLLDLKRVPELFARTKVLAMVLQDAIERDIDFLDAVTDLFARSLTAEDKPYVDVADLCLNLSREVSDPLVNEAARALGDFLIAPSTNVVSNSLTGKGGRSSSRSVRNAGETAKLNGISLYAPHVALANDFVAVRELYDNFDFARDTQWSELVHTLAQHAELELEAEESI